MVLAVGVDVTCIRPLSISELLSQNLILLSSHQWCIIDDIECILIHLYLRIEGGCSQTEEVAHEEPGDQGAHEGTQDLYQDVQQGQESWEFASIASDHVGNRNSRVIVCPGNLKAENI